MAGVVARTASDMKHSVSTDTQHQSFSDVPPPSYEDFSINLSSIVDEPPAYETVPGEACAEKRKPVSLKAGMLPVFIRVVFC